MCKTSRCVKQSFKGTVHRKIGRFKAAIQASTGHISTGKATTGSGLNSLRHRHQKILGDWRFNTEKQIFLPELCWNRGVQNWALFTMGPKLK
jgi:hypothetical protein